MNNKISRKEAIQKLGKYGIYNKEVSIIEKYGDIYKVKDSNGNFILTYKNNIM